MRSVAPEIPGIAVSQNSSPVVNAKPIVGRLITTTLQTIHTMKPSVSAGIEIHRLRRAILRPVCCQNVASSGFQSVIRRAWRGGGVDVGEGVATRGARCSFAAIIGSPVLRDWN